MHRIPITIVSATAFFATALAGIARPLGEVASIRQNGDLVEVHLDKEKTQGYIYLSVKSEDRRTTYWKLNLKYYDGGVIVLGKAPTKPQKKRGGGMIKIDQVTPVGEPGFPVNQKLLLKIGFRDGIKQAPGISTTTLKFELDQQGNLGAEVGDGDD